ncbi:MAG: hypothetical protein M9947_07040 [Thermomicrobiales bacterium]|nr:hypothetical protein [Thermomicrobiales bacterium]
MADLVALVINGNLTKHQPIGTGPGAYQMGCPLSWVARGPHCFAIE